MSVGTVPGVSASVPVAVSPPADILKSFRASRRGEYSTPPSNVN